MQFREIKSFFYSQYFSDGLRITIGVLLPSLILAQLHYFDAGVSMSLGALCISVVDTPGPVMHKRNAMAICNLCVFIVAVITGFARFNIYTLGIEVTLFSFLFSMFTIYGNRAASIGTGALLVMILMMDQAAKPADVLPSSAIILAGGVWYMLFSLVFFGIRPYRAAQQTLGESIDEVAKFLRIKAAFYLPDTDIDENYRKLVSQQIKVSQSQDLVREMLFKSRLLVRESTSASRILVLTFIDLVDMYENIMATHYDYAYLRDKFKHTGILAYVAKIIEHMANEVDKAAFIVLSNTKYKNPVDFTPELEKLKAKIDILAQTEPETSNIILKKILVNLRDMNQKITSIYNYYNSDSANLLFENRRRVEYSRFVTHQDYAPHIFTDNLSFDSAAFKHALRVALVCLIGFITAKTISQGHHSYWILLTIIVILKPGFSLSKQRNYQRLIGTIFGGIIGITLLILVPDKTVQFFCMVFFMLGCYSFLRFNYVLSVLFMTPYILIVFSFLGVNHIVQERITDTLIGSVIAFIASYLIFPAWEYEQIQQTLREMICANVNYLVKIAESLSGKTVDTTEYKLARKDVFVKSGNLSAAFERMTSEPKSKQKNIKEIHKFVVLNHILSSYIATVAAEIIGKTVSNSQPDIIRSIKKSLAVLNDTSAKLGGQKADFNTERSTPVSLDNKPELLVPDDSLLKEQLGFINKISADIARVSENILV
ncbi:FUSC family membrane protein [Mucilaginibacter sp. X5P1]|uniref:FUSC family membrane protein n=1 Tax=Mucilaginibacter sp. X5P1 TaxID=2723088 RepID=UPI001615F85C|nr:FUSC family membrane protein [Mucilaginibacter sp. X5P1]MBB6137374.1 putative membrane protein (TIGR01666 family) [Mucilaginibacter sp. X5P1]